jgi:hypothetical protein
MLEARTANSVKRHGKKKTKQVQAATYALEESKHENVRKMALFPSQIPEHDGGAKIYGTKN